MGDESQGRGTDHTPSAPNNATLLSSISPPPPPATSSLATTPPTSTTAPLTSVTATSATSVTTTSSASVVTVTVTAPIPSVQSTNQSAPKGPAVIAAAIVGVLFALVLVILGFLLWRRKKGTKSVAYITHDGPEKNAIDYAALQAQNIHLNSEVSRLNERANTLQAALLAANASSGPLAKFVPRQSRDDKQICMEFDQITQEIKDYAGNYFKSSRSAGRSGSPELLISQVPPQLAATIARVIPGWEQVLQEEGSKGKSTIVRAVVWSMLQKAWEEGEIFGKLGFEQMTIYIALLENDNDMGDVQFWRRATFAMLGHSPTFNTMRNQATTNISQQIDQLLSPLASAPPSTERYQFLYGIVQKVTNLALELAQQAANYRVQVADFTFTQRQGQGPVHFEANTMDDVMQVYPTAIGADGAPKNVMEGRPIRAIVSPAVIKWGDHRGENWGRVTVVTRAKVLL